MSRVRVWIEWLLIAAVLLAGGISWVIYPEFRTGIEYGVVVGAVFMVLNVIVAWMQDQARMGRLLLALALVGTVFVIGRYQGSQVPPEVVELPQLTAEQLQLLDDQAVQIKALQTELTFYQRMQADMRLDFGNFAGVMPYVLLPGLILAAVYALALRYPSDFASFVVKSLGILAAAVFVGFGPIMLLFVRPTGSMFLLLLVGWLIGAAYAGIVYVLANYTAHRAALNPIAHLFGVPAAVAFSALFLLNAVVSGAPAVASIATLMIGITGGTGVVMFLVPGAREFVEDVQQIY